MVIYAVMSVKDEGDILEFSLTKNLEWANRIFVVDNESADDTREIVERFDGDRVILLATFHGQFQEGIKSIPFSWLNASNSYPKPDWWAVLDADEYYYDNPKKFLADVPSYCSRVCTNCCEFIGLERVSKPLDPVSYSHYIPLRWSESRFYRNIRSLHWSDYKDNGPSGVGAVYKKRIRILHFPFRSVEQIEKRLAIRKQNKGSSGIAWSNSMFHDASDLLKNYKSGRLVENNGHLFFEREADNFLSKKSDKFKRLIKIFMFYFGFYRKRN